MTMDALTFATHLAAGRFYGEEATCGTKTSHATEEAATKAAESLNRSGRGRHEVEAYPCPWCLKWHIGRKMSWRELCTFTPSHWQMHAHRYDDGVLRHVGPLHYVKAHTMPFPVVSVDVAEIEPNPGGDFGTHWGWLPRDKDDPVMIWPSWAQFTICFPYGPRAEEKAERGRVVRLRVTIKMTEEQK